MSHHSPFIPKSTLELAKERLFVFMSKHKASVDECAKLMGLASSDDLHALTAAEERHSHDAMVMQFFAFDSGADNKLKALRCAPAPSPVPFDDEDMSETHAVSDIKKPAVSKTIQPKPTFNQDAAAADKVIKILDALKAELQVSDYRLSLMLGFGGTFMGGVRDRVEGGKLKGKAVKNILSRVEALRGKSKAEIEKAKSGGNQKTAANTDKVVDITHRPFAQEGDQAQPSTETVRITPELACLDETIDFMLGNEEFIEAFYKRVAAKAEQRVADILGASPEDLKGVAPMVDMLIAAKRGGLRVRMVVES